jgi:hypothetical protein
VELVEADLEAINCTLGGGGAVPDPVFEDSGANGETDNDGDYAIVDLTCTFPLITPLAEAIIGGPVALAAHEEFPIHVRHVQGVPPPPPPPPTCPAGTLEVPDLVNVTMGAARDLWVADGFLEANFDPAVISTGPPADRNISKLVLTQSIAENACEPPTASITVTHAP